MILGPFGTWRITDGFSGDFDENTMTGGMEKCF